MAIAVMASACGSDDDDDSAGPSGGAAGSTGASSGSGGSGGIAGSQPEGSGGASSGGTAGSETGTAGSGSLTAAECPARLVAQARALDDAILGFIAGTIEQRVALAEACSGIATDLGISDLPAVSEYMLDEDLHLLCSEALAALQPAIESDDASYAINPGSVSCIPDPDAHQDCDPTCEVAGSSDQECLDFCEAYAAVTVACTGTPPTVSSVNSVLVATLEAHLSVVQAAMLWCSQAQPLGQELIDAAAAIRAEVTTTAGCSEWIPHLPAWLALPETTVSVAVLLDAASEIDVAASAGG